MLEAVFLHDALRVGAPSRLVVDRLEQIAGTVDSDLTRARSAHACALRDADPDALEALAERFERMGARLLAAEATRQAAGLFDQRGAASRARASLARSAALADRCRGARTPVLADGRPRVLTVREREVVALAARGLSNRAIAEQLVVSIRTVESHLYTAMAKLGATSRRDLPRLVG